MVEIIASRLCLQSWAGKSTASPKYMTKLRPEAFHNVKVAFCTVLQVATLCCALPSLKVWQIKAFTKGLSVRVEVDGPT